MFDNNTGKAINHVMREKMKLERTSQLDSNKWCIACYNLWCKWLAQMDIPNLFIGLYNFVETVNEAGLE